MTKTADHARVLAYRALHLDDLAAIDPARLEGPDPEVPGVTWRDVAVILDASEPNLPYVEEVFAEVAERPLPLPDAERVAVRVDLLGCAGLKPLVARFGHGIRLWDAERQMTVAAAVAACAETTPPPEHLVLVSDRAPTGDWQPALARWRVAVERHGRVPQTSHVIWGEHLGELDGFALASDPARLRHLGSRAELRALLTSLWQSERQPGEVRSRARRPSRVLKPWVA
jgi:hypothetical protein